MLVKIGFLALLFCTLLSVVSPTNLCSTAGLCCKHRDSECVVQKVYPNHTVDTSQLPCYCDHACLRLDDCCPDYKHFCAVQDCKVSEWGPWSLCSVRCGSGGITERHRVILHQASNGGNSCPHLVQGKACVGKACDEHEPEEKWTEGLTSSPSSSSLTVSPQRSFDNGTDTDESIRQKQELFHTLVASEKSHHHTDDYDLHSSCMEMVIIRATVGCQHHDSRLHIGTRICVNCPYNKPTMITSKYIDDEEEVALEENCAELTQTPIRKFRISSHCHGKLTFLAPDPTSKCSCSRGLHFRLLPEENV